MMDRPDWGYSEVGGYRRPIASQNALRSRSASGSAGLTCSRLNGIRASVTRSRQNRAV